MPHQVVVDTNVLVAALRSRRGASFQLIRSIGLGLFTPNISVALALEYESVLRRKDLVPGSALTMFIHSSPSCFAHPIS
jgi:predicted nucleic acid-binding protein